MYEDSDSYLHLMVRNKKSQGKYYKKNKKRRKNVETKSYEFNKEPQQYFKQTFDKEELCKSCKS